MKKFMRKIKKKLKKIKVPKNLILFLLGGFFMVVAIFIIWISSFKIPDLSAFTDRIVPNSTKIYDRTGEVLLYNVYQDVKRTDVSFENMGENIKMATVAIEDAEFYKHKGVRITSTVRAVLSNILSPGGNTQGGSTITQQLVKNTLLTQRKTIGRKIKEWVLALKIEKAMDKDEILEYYLNESPYGGTIYGIQEASTTYFGKNPADLSLAEAAYLAAIPQSPTYLSPYGKNKSRLDDRKNLVLSRMRELGFITREEQEAARAEEVEWQPQVIGSIKAPHFVFFIKQYLENKYGSEMVEKGGLRVITTIDAELQLKAEEIVKEEAYKNAQTWNGENAALVAIDPKTGQILSMVGSRDYFDKDIDGNFNVAADGLRQPGSAFKPFIYAAAFNKGFTDKTILFDVPTQFNSSCGPYQRSDGRCYMPDNYDGLFRGPMTLRAALAESINVPAVKLFYLAGLRESLKVAEDMGISTLTDISRYGLTLVIGGGEVTLLDMTSSYGVFATGGVRNPYTGILRIEDLSGRVLEEFRPNSRQVLPRNSALMISDILSDNQARIPTFGASSALLIPGRDTAAKTGTTNSNRDAWTVGYSPGIVVGVWAGNNDNTPMRRGGVAMAGPIWNRFMVEALKKIPNETFEEPDLFIDPTARPVLRGYWQGGESFLIDKVSGKLATEYTPREAIEERIITNVHSILFWVDKSNIHGPVPENPAADPQFRNWEVAVNNWWNQNRHRYPIITAENIPTEVDDVHTDANRPRINILEPNDDRIYSPSEELLLSLEISSVNPIERIDAFVNDMFMGSFDLHSGFSIRLQEVGNLEYRNELKLVYNDSLYNRGESRTIFYVE